MRILNIGTDKSLIGGKQLGDAKARHAVYGQSLDSLDIIVYSNRREGFSKHQISGNVTGYPSNSCCKAMFVFDCLKLFKKINQGHQVQVIVCQDPFVCGLCGVIIKLFFPVKLQVNFHGDFWQNGEWLKERPINWLFLLISKFVIKKADGIRVVSSGIKNKLIAKGIDQNKIRVIATPVDLEKFQNFDVGLVERIKSEYQGKKIILFVGRLEPVKDYPTLLEALMAIKPQLSEFVVLVIGDGSQKTAWEQLTVSAGLEEQVKFLGQLDHGQLVNYYYAGDFLVSASTNESLGKNFIEAGACGKPSVATATTGAKEVILDNQSGLLSPIKDSEKMAENILKLLGDVNLCQAYGQKAKELMWQNFDGKKNTEKIINFWQELIK